MRRNLQRSLAFKIQKLSNTFRGQQKEYLGKLRAQKEGTLGQVGKSVVGGLMMRCGGGWLEWIDGGVSIVWIVSR